VETSGHVKPVAQSLAAALRNTGILAFQARPSLFEFVAADIRSLTSSSTAIRELVISDSGLACPTSLSRLSAL